MSKKTAIALSSVRTKIGLIRGHRVLLDADLAALYGVETKALIQSVKRNRSRFPEDFMFQLTQKEFTELRSTVFGATGYGGRRYPPYAFTEQGVAMLSSVLRSTKAVKVNVSIMRAFVQLREMLAGNEELSRKLNALEKKFDSQFSVVFDAIRQLVATSTKPRNQIGFTRRVGSRT